MYRCLVQILLVASFSLAAQLGHATPGHDHGHWWSHGEHFFIAVGILLAVSFGVFALASSIIKKWAHKESP